MWTWLISITARIRAFFHLNDDDRDLALEFESHLTMLAEDKIRAGMSEEAARRQARLELGGLAQLQQEHRDVRALPFLETLLQDLRYTFRTLRRDAAFATFAILIIAIGIGASSTVLTVVNAVLLRPLPYEASDRLVWISNIADNKVDEWRIQVGHYLDLQQQNKSFADLAAYLGDYGSGEQLLSGTGEPERLTAVPVSQNFLPFLGVNPFIGRQFNVEEFKWNGPRAVLLSYSFWRRRFSSDPAIVGQAIILNGMPSTVAGVLPASFNFSTVFDPGRQVELFVPFPLSRETNRWGNTLTVLGRLKPGITIDSARAEFEVLGRQLTLQHSNWNTLRPKLTPLAERVNGRFRPALLVLAWAVGVVMLIVCANLSNLQLSRMATRKKEMAIRVALGAGRIRLIRQLLTESIVLSCCGAALGLMFAVTASRVLSHLDTFNIPLLESVRVDTVTFVLTMVIAVLTGVVFGLMPALQVPVLSVNDDLKEGSRGTSEGKRRGWIRGALVVSEVAFACVLLVEAGLLIRSFLRVLDVNLGFQPDRASALRIDPGTRFADQAKRSAYYEEILRRAQAVPGIEAAALASVLPLGGNRSRGVAGKGQIYARDNYPQGFLRVVSGGYFRAMGVPLRAGRDFSERDNASSEPVVILNEMLARTLWPGQDPIGQIITEGGGRRVIGIVGDVRHKALEEGFTGEMYIPIRQTGEYSNVELVVRTGLTHSDMAASVKAALVPIAPNLPKNEWRPLRQLVDKSVSPRRFVVLLLGGFSAFALILASLGIYGVVSYSVSQRTQEIGIRIALGASAGDVQSRIMLGTLRLAAIGMAIGFVASWAVGSALTGLLFGLTPTDPITFFGIALLLSTVAAIAGYLPARRATRIDPIIALRAN